MKLCIADPPYPPMVQSQGWMRRRASRWYGDMPVAASDRPADVHPEAAAWDDQATHRQLLKRLLDEFDGWAIATSSDGLAAYGELPAAVRIMAWIKPNSQPGSHRIKRTWEPVILYPPRGRRGNRGGLGCVPDVLIQALPRERGFIGAKPPQWFHWVLDAMSYDPDQDEVTDLFPGSGAGTHALATYALPLSIPGQLAAPAQGFTW